MILRVCIDILKIKIKHKNNKFLATYKVTNKYIAIYVRYYNDTEGQIRLKVYNVDKLTIIYGE